MATEGVVAAGGLPHRLVGADATAATTAQWGPGSQHNSTTMAPCGNGGPSLFRQDQSLPWVKSKPNASTVSLLRLPLASSAVLILTRPRPCWAR